MQALEKESDLQKAVIAAQQKQIDDSSAWYHDPIKVGAIGFVVGLVGGLWLAHHN